MRALALSMMLLGLTPAALAVDGAAVDRAAAALSVYPRGHLPPSPTVLDAIALIGAHGAAPEVAILDEIARTEGPDVAPRAAAALDAVRARLADERRVRFRDELPGAAEIAAGSRRWRQLGLPTAAAACVAYTEAVLRDEARPSPHRRHAAAALADRGELRKAVRAWAADAADGSDEAFAALLGMGVDPERLLLGLVAAGWTEADPALAVLARKGERLTAEVLAERVERADADDRARAADALGRMLSPRERARPLSPEGADLARKALQRAAADAAPDVAPIARRALAAIDD